MKVVAYFKDINIVDRYNNLLKGYNFKIVNEYNKLYDESQNEVITVLLNIQDCENGFDNCILPLIEMNMYVIVLDSTPSFEKGKELISLGIKAYGNLMMDDIHLKEAINSVMDGNVWLYPEFINQTVLNMKLEVNKVNADEKLEVLSVREKEVAKLVIKKLTYPEISQELGISLRTVKAHTKNIYEKFEVANRLAFLLLFNK